MNFIQSLISWLLPFFKVQPEPNEQSRHQIFVSVSSFIASPFCLLYAVFEYQNDEFLLMTLLLLAAMLMGIGFAYYRSNRYHSVFSRALFAYLVLLIFVQILHDRGQYTLYFVFLMPPITTYLFGVREGLIWSLGTFFACMAIMLFPEVFSVYSLSGCITNFIGAFVILCCFSAGLESLRHQAQMRLEKRNRELQQEHDRLINTQQNLAASEARFRAYSELASDWLFELDENLFYTFATAGLNEVVGGTIVGQSISETPISTKEHGAETKLMSEHKDHVNQQVSFVNYQGQRMEVLFSARAQFDDAGKFAGYIGAGKDITAIHEAQEELRIKDQVLNHIQKLEALGQLTSGVAHDFNNLLTVISGNLELLDQKNLLDADRGKVDAASRAAARAADLTNQLLSFSRKQDLKPKAVNIGEILKGLADMCSRTMGSAIIVRQNIETNLHTSLVDQGQLESALLNLSLNARDAMSGRGQLTLTACNVTLDEHNEPISLPHGEYVSISVTDSGMGMEQQQVARIMEPFFTTKPPGQGTGLGLSMAYGFAVQSGGTLEVKTEPGEGSTFTLYLPAAGNETTQDEPTETHATSPTKTHHVVLVEDDPDVQQVLISSLQHSGYQVTAFNSAEAALEGLNTKKPDILITDLMLGSGMTGAELADQINESSPHLPLLLISGNAYQLLSKEELDKYSSMLLRKPFSIQQLRAAMEKLIL